MTARPRLPGRPSALLICLTLVGCAGDLGADSSLPACNARPVDPAGFESDGVRTIEASDHIGHTYSYRGMDGTELSFHFGVTSDAAAGLPKKDDLPLQTGGAGQLHGGNLDWAFVWTDQFPCDQMAVVGSGLDRPTFVGVLGLSGVTPREEEEGEGGAEGEVGGVEEELEEENEASEGILPPGGPAVEFLGVFETALDVNDLDSITRELMESAPNNFAISPITCWKGLPQQLGVPRDRYVAAVVAITRNELDFVVEGVGRAPIFYGQLRSRCND